MYLYLVRYHCNETGGMRWLAEAVDMEKALKIAAAFDRDGTAYVIHLVHADPGFLLLTKDKRVVARSVGKPRKKTKKLATV